MEISKVQALTQAQRDMHQRLFSSIESRMPWPIVQAIFRHLDIPTGHGIKATFQKLRQQVATDSSIVSKIPELNKYYIEHYLFGEKIVRIYSIKGDNLYKKIKDINFGIVKSPFDNVYPYLIDQDSLANLPHDSFLVETNSIGGGLNFVFCSKRYVTERVEYDKEQIEKYEDFRDFDEIIAVRHRARQLFDVVFVHVLNGDTIIEVRQDAPFDMPSDEIEFGFKTIWQTFAKFIYSKTKENNSELHPVNLFPAVRSLYGSAEGRVCELGFTTDTGTVQSVKMRKRDVDLAPIPRTPG